MDEKEILERFGISKNFGILLLIQSILVIVGFIFTIFRIYELIPSGFDLILIINIITLFTYVCILIYSFAGFKKAELYYTSGVGLFLILILSNLLLNNALIVKIIFLIVAILLVYFLLKLNDYSKARIAILLVIILEIIIAFLSISSGIPWYGIIKTLILPCTIALTYESRYKRGLYGKK